jgi:hypothetical protein
MTFVILLWFLSEHGLFGKPVPTFPDHALSRKPKIVPSRRTPARGVGVVACLRCNRACEEQDLYAAIDLLVDKLDRQVLKYKGKRQDKSHEAPRRAESS